MTKYTKLYLILYLFVKGARQKIGVYLLFYCIFFNNRFQS